MKKEEDSNSFNDCNSMKIDEFFEDNDYFLFEEYENLVFLQNNDNKDINNSNIQEIEEPPKLQKKRKREKSSPKDGSPLIPNSPSNKKEKIFQEKSKYNFKLFYHYCFWLSFKFSDFS